MGLVPARSRMPRAAADADADAGMRCMAAIGGRWSHRARHVVVEIRSRRGCLQPSQPRQPCKVPIQSTHTVADICRAVFGREDDSGLGVKPATPDTVSTEDSSRLPPRTSLWMVHRSGLGLKAVEMEHSSPLFDGFHAWLPWLPCRPGCQTPLACLSLLVPSCRRRYMHLVSSSAV